MDDRPEVGACVLCGWPTSGEAWVAGSGWAGRCMRCGVVAVAADALPALRRSAPLRQVLSIQATLRPDLSEPFVVRPARGRSRRPGTSTQGSE